MTRMRMRTRDNSKDECQGCGQVTTMRYNGKNERQRYGMRMQKEDIVEI